MKTNFAIALIMLGCCSAFGQGTLLLQNLGPGVNAPVFGFPPDCVKLSGERYKAQLVAGTSASSLSPVATTSFSSLPSAAGYFLGGMVTLPGIPAEARPFLQVQIWDSATGATYAEATLKGASVVFQLGAPLGNPDATPPTPPPALVGIVAISLCIPEPSIAALAVVGVLIFLLWPTRQRGASRILQD